ARERLPRGSGQHQLLGERQTGFLEVHRKYRGAARRGAEEAAWGTSPSPSPPSALPASVSPPPGWIRASVGYGWRLWQPSSRRCARILASSARTSAAPSQGAPA